MASFLARDFNERICEAGYYTGVKRGVTTCPGGPRGERAVTVSYTLITATARLPVVNPINPVKHGHVLRSLLVSQRLFDALIPIL